MEAGREWGVVLKKDPKIRHVKQGGLARRNQRVKVLRVGDLYSVTSDAFCLLGLGASVASVSVTASPALILVRHSLVRTH
jgi:hypothetical protein